MSELYLVDDITGDGSGVFRATSPRQAVMRYVYTRHGVDHPKLSKMYEDGADGRVYHVGYIYRQSWLNVSTITPVRVPEGQ